MQVRTGVADHHGQELGVEFTSPDTCPLCHHGVEPRFLIAAWLRERQRLEAVFRCPRLGCQHLFIASYTSRYGTSSNWQLTHVAPAGVQTPEFPEAVTKVSPAFVEIMEQVAYADAKSLDQLIGMGLRKAIEFLIKDFCVQEYPDQKGNIEKSELAYVIGQYVKDANIKAAAKRAAWLGNDETHYLCRWTDKDIKNLKELVKLTVNWIESYLLTRQYEQEMPEGKL
jgi:hypothetical protein